MTGDIAQVREKKARKRPGAAISSERTKRRKRVIADQGEGLDSTQGGTVGQLKDSPHKNNYTSAKSCAQASELNSLQEAEGKEREEGEIRTMIAAKSLSFSLTTGSLGPWRAPPAAPGKGKLWVGTSGYIYPHWKSVVYPDRLPQKHWFDYYARLFDTVEINNTFYRLPEGKVFAGWREQAPEGFRFAVKFSRYGTHMKKLKDPEGPLGMFFEKAAHLGPDGALGPVLVQLPPSFGLQLARLEAFLQQLRAVAPTAQKVALEVRDARWLTDDVYALLRRFHVALCIHDHKDIKCPHPQVVTADWSYLRFHGHDYSQCYADEALREHARWIRGRLEAGGDVYAYFNNDQHAHAVRNALSLREIILDA